MNKCRTILALVLTAGLMLSFASGAFALEQQHDDKEVNPCGHVGRSITGRTSTLYSSSSLGCAVYLRIYYRCNVCQREFYIDEFIRVQDHIRVDYDKGHVGSNRHAIGVRCRNCKIKMGSDYTVTCYGPPCTALPFSVPGYTLQIN